jgi:hypothetical protein
VTAAPPGDPRDYYTRAVPEQWNRIFEARAARADDDPRAADAMRAVNESIHVEVRNGTSEHFFLDIEGGRMSAVETPAHPPFLHVILGHESFRNLASEAGDSLLALLGALAGRSGDLVLTPRRVGELIAVAGGIRFEVTGAAGFSVLTRLGDAAEPEHPDAVVRMPEACYRDLRAGRLDPEAAFLSDAVHVEGDLQKVMQLAFAAVAPD